MHYTSMDILFICLHSITGFLGVFGNASLLAAIKFRSPSSWKSYTILLSNCALIDLIACFCSWISIERVVPFPLVTVSIYLGPCTLISGFFCHCMHATMAHTFVHSLILVLMAFYYRLYVIGRQAPSKSRMIIFCIVIYLPTFAVLIITFFTNDPSEEVRKALLTYYPDHDQFKDYVIQGRVDVQPHFWIRVATAYVTVPLLPLCIIVFIVRRKVIGKLRATENAMAVRTREMHKSLVTVLTLQASLPMLFLMAIMCYLLLKRQIFVASFLEYFIIFVMSLMPSIAPFITLYNVKPLRNFVLRRDEETSRGTEKSTVPSMVLSTTKRF